MGHEELKTEIIKLLDNIPDMVLEDVLIILKDMESNSKIATDEELLEQIISEGKNLLKKLELN